MKQKLTVEELKERQRIRDAKYYAEHKEERQRIAREQYHKDKEDESKVARRKQCGANHRNKYREELNKRGRDKWHSEEEVRKRALIPKRVKMTEEELAIKKKEQDARYYREHKEERVAAMRVWRKNNPDKIKEGLKRNAVKETARRKKRYHNDPLFNLKLNLNSLIRQSLRKHGAVKTKRTTELTGCSMKELKKRLESKFDEFMTWKNKGKSESQRGWDIDHIIPCSSFDLSDPNQQKKCYHYTNLQPLWWWENVLKSNKTATEWELYKNENTEQLKELRNKYLLPSMDRKKYKLNMDLVY